MLKCTLAAIILATRFGAACLCPGRDDGGGMRRRLDDEDAVRHRCDEAILR